MSKQLTDEKVANHVKKLHKEAKEKLDKVSETQDQEQDSESADAIAQDRIDYATEGVYEIGSIYPDFNSDKANKTTNLNKHRK